MTWIRKLVKNIVFIIQWMERVLEHVCRCVLVQKRLRMWEKNERVEELKKGNVVPFHTLCRGTNE